MPPPKFKRLTIGGEVRLMGAYIVKCESVEKNPDGSIAAIHCTADLETGNGNPADGRKVKARSIGSALPTASTLRCACTTSCSPRPNIERHPPRAATTRTT